MRAIVFCFLLFNFFCILPGCSQKVGTLAIVSSRNINLNMQEFVKVAEVAEGQSVAHVIIFVPTGLPNIDEAVENVLQVSGGDIMTNVTIYYKWWTIPIIYYRFYYEVKGSVWKLKDTSMGILEKESLEKADKIYEAIQVDDKTVLIEKRYPHDQ